MPRLVTLIGVVGTVVVLVSPGSTQGGEPARHVVPLPAPELQGSVSLEEAQRSRRSVRSFSKGASLSLEEISRLLWSAQGTTRDGRRTTPSAGALYPLEIDLVAGSVEGLSKGVYRYRPQSHDLIRRLDGEMRGEVATAALEQAWIRDAAVVIVISAVYERTTVKYGQRGLRYVHIEVGLAAQNIYLQAAALNLGTTFVGAFEDSQVMELLGLAADEHPLGLMPVGRTG